MDMKPKFRHEIKHNINMSDYMGLQQRLKAVTRPDPYADETGKYRIRSLYFDNFEDKALMEKINGVNNREKFRIRYYNDDFGRIRLEKKSKVNGLCCKRSAGLTQEQCLKIMDGDTGWMRCSVDPLIIEFYAKMNFQQLRPRTVVDYVREPYVYGPGNVRVTIDSQIRTGLNSKELFNQELTTTRINSEDVIILEVKYDDFLPAVIRDILQVNDRQSSAFSKYVECRVYG